MAEIIAKELKLSQIRMDGGTQPRAELSEAVIAEYAEDLKNGADFPPVTVFYDGKTYWLADGYHRAGAYRAGGKKTIQAEIHQGTQRDAILHSVGANADHGFRRTNADKRRAVETLLRDEAWGTNSENWIAKTAAVHHSTVTNIREHLLISKSDIRQTSDGRTINTANIGRKPSSKQVVVDTVTGEEVAEIVKPVPRRATGFGGISPRAHRPVRGHSEAPAKTHFDLPHDPSSAARALRSFFDDEFLAALVRELGTYLKGQAHE